ncbi:activin receptor type-2A isoform X2 [Phlebotomus argentipes]|uniref:activin receptor type-2A isoform X2 n=1 Tax=Phlebotomus argentipes TaxID=94469 RepID=UPI002892E481|nr:activin receptor type-2A isoform X2 [Phlebotomus argentipes]
MARERREGKMQSLQLCSSIAIILGFICCISGSVVVSKQLECELYDIHICREHGDCETTKKVCEEVDADKQNHCYVVWQQVLNETTGKLNVTVQMKGCFTQNAACNQTECIDYSYEPKNNMNFCCCQGDFCNHEQKWLPQATKPTDHEDYPQHQEETDNVYIICTLLVAFLVITGLASLGYYYLRKRTKQAHFNEVPTIEPEVTSSSPCLALRPIQLIEIKARGRFGAVWRAQMKPDEVAVKIFPQQDKQSWQTEQEIFKLPRMRHPNILEFIGVEKHIENSLSSFWLITVYHNRGSLCDYLKAYTVTWAELCKIAESMARGLMHLHEEIPATKGEQLKPAIAHRDFKSKNVLLKQDLTACIADFGLALIFQPGKPCGDTHGQVGTRRYMAPEVLEGAINFTRDAFLRIDVYACGLVLWELVSRCSAHGGPVPEYTLPFETELGSHPTLDEMQDNVVMKKLRPRISNQWRTHPGLSAMSDTMEECWDHDAEARLSSSCVMERVSQHTRYQTTQLLIESNTDPADNV